MVSDGFGAVTYTVGVSIEIEGEMLEDALPTEPAGWTQLGRGATVAGTLLKRLSRTHQSSEQAGGNPMTIEDINALFFVFGAAVLITFMFCFVVVGVEALRDMASQRKRKGYRGRYRPR